MTKEFDGYLVSTNGNIIKIKNNKKIKTHFTKQGYVRLTLNGKKYLMHHLLAQLFIPNPNNLPMVNHKDENKSNNDLNNLEWCDNQYNKEYSQGKKVAQYDLEGNFIAEYKSSSSCARAIGILPSSVSAVARGEKKSYKGFVFVYV